jgi:hypothetical protein
MSYIQCRKDNIDGVLIHINLAQIVSFEKYLKLAPNEQWYQIVTTNGEKFYTLYNLMQFSIYNFPNF